MTPTHYAKSGELNIAYRVLGDGPPDLVYVPGWVSNVEVMQEDPGMARFLRRLASFSRLIYFDKRGIGLSDPVPLGELPDLETRVEDLRAVMDASGAERAGLFGHSEGGSTAVAFAAAYPERVERLILFGSYAKRLWSEDYPWAPTWEEREAESEGLEQAWDDPSRIAEYYAPSRADDAAFIEWVGRWLRLSASPKAAASLNRASSHIDVTDVLSRIRLPTLLLYRRDDYDVRIEEGRYIASKIPGAKLVELAGADHFFWAGDTEPILQEIEEFVTGHRAAAAPERRLATALFTDIVGSTDTAAALGDQRWRDLLHRHNDVVRAELAKWRGVEVKATGDGFLATFDSPAQAIYCARAIVERVVALGIEVRSGIHTGEMEIADHDVGGLAVHIGARIAGLPGPARCWCRERSRISWRAPDSCSRAAAVTSSGVYRTSGSCSELGECQGRASDRTLRFVPWPADIARSQLASSGVGCPPRDRRFARTCTGRLELPLLTESHSLLEGSAYESQLVIFESSGHYPHAEEPRLFVEVVTKFVDHRADASR